MSHPDFDRAPESRRFRGGSLVLLWSLLNEQLDGKPLGVHVCRVLVSGACVSLRHAPDGSRVLRISRSEGFKTAEGPKKFAAEIDTFVEHFGIRSWTRVEDLSAEGVAMLLYERDPHPKCKTCGRPIDRAELGPLVEECVDCATAAQRPIPEGWQKCSEPDCTHIVEINPQYEVNRCQPCAMRAGRQFSMELGGR